MGKSSLFTIYPTSAYFFFLYLLWIIWIWCWLLLETGYWTGGGDHNCEHNSPIKQCNVQSCLLLILFGCFYVTVLKILIKVILLYWHNVIITPYRASFFKYVHAGINVLCRKVWWRDRKEASTELRATHLQGILPKIFCLMLNRCLQLENRHDNT